MGEKKGMECPEGESNPHDLAALDPEPSVSTKFHHLGDGCNLIIELLLCQLPAGGLDFSPFFLANRRLKAPFDKSGSKSLHFPFRGRLEGKTLHPVPGDQIDEDRKPGREPHQCVKIRFLVIDARQKKILERNPVPGGVGILP